ncbi:MAG TPA: hypothetical protein VND93_29325 [Myxococcales bacterium]|jgi:hypothetical protein|nr:hypothetical protein [Myxococcales bacterium]
MNAQQITIEETTTATLSAAVRVGCGNFWEETYQEGGKEQTGHTAGLWVMKQGAAASDHVRVHAGQVLQVPGYKLKVLEVTPGVGMAHGAVKIEVEPAAS